MARARGRSSHVQSGPWRCVLLAAAVMSACVGADDPTLSSPPQPVEANAPTVLADLCAAQEAAGDPAEARTAFARAHGPLHDLARDVQSRDRQAAARLLEHKQRVESALERDPAPGTLTTPLADLVEATRRAQEAVGSPAPPCR